MRLGRASCTVDLMDAGLRAELLRRADIDQAARADPAASARLASVDADNLRWLQEVIAARGWPGRSLAGADGAHAAWLLAQHAVGDPAFQRRCLDLLREAEAAGEATAAEVAYLTDRVLLVAGEPQVYGTQLISRDGVCQPWPLRDPDAVNGLRAAAGLEPLAGYLALAADGPGQPRAMMPCPECGRDIELAGPGAGGSWRAACDCGWAAAGQVTAAG